MSRLRLSTRLLARASAEHPWRAVAAWLVVFAASVAAIVLLLGSALETEGTVTADTESNRAYDVLERAFPSREDEEEAPEELVVFRSEALAVEDGAFRERVERFARDARGLGREVVRGTTTYYETRNRQLVSSDRHATIVTVALAGEEAVEHLLPLVEAADGKGAFDVEIYGSATVERDFQELSQHDLKSGELKFGVPAALVILLLVFGAVVAGLVPLLLAALAITVALGLTALVGQAYTFSFFVTNMISGIGLALGIDYSLFVLSRYREERARGLDKLAAIETAGETASRAVFFSGLAVALGLLGMVLVPDSIMRSLGAGAILVAISSVLVALTLTPAVLSLLGDRVDSLRLPLVGRSVGAGAEGRFWGWIARAVTRRPVASLVLSSAFLLACAAPVLTIETGQAGVSTLPDRLAAKQGFVAFERSFPTTRLQPARVVVTADAGSPRTHRALERLRRELERDPRVGPTTVEETADGEVASLTVPVTGDPFGEKAEAAVRDLRAELVPRAFSGVPAEVLVTGATAEEIDYVELTNRYLPVVFAFVLGLSFVLLTVAFRSIVLALKAILLNLLSVGAAYGLLVLVFQHGVGADLLGLRQVAEIEAWVPLFLFSLLFGLSMDYHVFLLTRIREHFLATGDNTQAVAFGVASTARVITGAAFIIIAVFVGFAAGDMVMFQQMGFGVAVALFLDATIIRSVLVPASMKLLGRWNWYLPSWLEWLPELHAEGEEPRVRRPAAAAR